MANISLSTPIVTIFRINDDLFARALDGISSEQLWRRLTERNNSMLWIAGHITHTRAEMLGLMGSPFDTGWRDLFARGSSVGDSDKYPSIGEIKRVLGEINEKMYAMLESLDEAQLAKPFPGSEQPQPKTVADQLAGFAFHDCYHVGQLGYIRKGLGHAAVAR